MNLNESTPAASGKALPPAFVTVSTAATAPDQVGPSQHKMSGHRAVAQRDFLRRMPARDRAQQTLLESIEAALAAEEKGGTK